MKIYCISEGELHLIENGKEKTVTCRRIADYLTTIQKMKQRDEWKTTGKGAKFMGVEPKSYEVENCMELLRSVAVCGDKLIYSTFIDGMGGMYFKEISDNSDGDENYIFTNQELDITAANCKNGKTVISAGGGRYERHIFAADTESGRLNQLTEGFTSEQHPCISAADSDRIYYTAMGYARDQYGNVVEKSPCSIDCLNTANGNIDTVISDDEYDFLKPQDDIDGNLYYIKRKYEPTKKKGNLLLDIVMFPVRIIKAIGGFLSVFSMAFGGEPLRTGGKNPAKSRSADERQVFVEGNMINAQKQLSDNDDSGIIPSGWTLVKRSKDGTEEALKKGVMDYRLCDNGDIVYSNGSCIGIISGGRDTRLAKLKLANSIAIIG